MSASQVVKVDAYGNVVSFGRQRTRDPAMAIALARTQQANRVLAAAITGRVSSSGGTPRPKAIYPAEVFTGGVVGTNLGPDKSTFDASLALVNDALDAIFFDANAVAAVIGVPAVTFGGGGTKASPIAAISGSGTGSSGPPVATMNTIRVQMDTNMITAAALVNKILRATGHEPLHIQSSGDVQPPPDDYGAGGTGLGGGTSTAGSSHAFGADAPFTNPTPAITEDSGTYGTTAHVTAAQTTAALNIWRDNVETMAQRMAGVVQDNPALTNSTTGTLSTTNSVVEVTAFAANTAETATTLAGATSTSAALASVKNSIASLFYKANVLAGVFGVPVRSYTGGGTVSDTLAAVTAVTAATVGAQNAELEAIRAQWNLAFDALAEHVNTIAAVADVPLLNRVVVTSSFPFDNPVNPKQIKSGLNATTQAQNRYATDYLSPVPGSTIGATGGTSADPGVLKTSVDARLVEAKNNLTTIATTVNLIRASLAASLVKIV